MGAGAPLLFVVAWVLFSRMGLEVSAILSIQLWRSSAAGLITMLPALLVQISAMLFLSCFGKIKGFRWLKVPLVSRCVSGLLLISVSAAAAAIGWATIEEQQRRELLRLEFTAKSGCEFNMTTIPSLPHRVDEVVAIPGRTFRSELTSYTLKRIYLVLPYGKVLRRRLLDFIDPVSQFTVCNIVSNSSPVQISNITIMSGVGILPLDLMALAAAIITVILLAGTHIGAIFSPLLPDDGEITRPIAPQ